MDENVVRVLQMLQDGKISAQEAEMLIAAMRGESTAPVSEPEPADKEPKEEKSIFGNFEAHWIKPPKIDLDNLGERISKAVAKVQPEKIVRRVQTQLRTATRASAQWGTNMSTRVRNWTDGVDSRPANESDWPQQEEIHEQEFHLEANAKVFVENPIGNIKVIGLTDGPASVTVRKTFWSARAEDLKTVASHIEVNIHGTDARLDIKVSAPETFRDGTVDLDLRIPRNVENVRVSTHYGDIDISEVGGLAEAVTTTGALNLHDLSGDARGETASGDLKVANVAGSVTVATQSGDISAEQISRGLSANTASGDVHAAGIEGGRVECKSVSGDASLERAGLLSPVDITVESISGDTSLKDANGSIALKAVSGDVTAEKLTATRLQAQTVSGDVKLGLREPFSSTMQVNTVSGDVRIHLPEGSNVRVSLSTSSGELRCDHEVLSKTATDTLWIGQIGTGAGTLNVQTISGDTRIERTGSDDTHVESSNGGTPDPVIDSSHAQG